MKIYKQTIKQVEVIPEWQALMLAEPRRKLEAARGQIMSCKSCRQPIIDKFMVVVHIKGKLNKIVHEKCADKSVPILKLEMSNQ